METEREREREREANGCYNNVGKNIRVMAMAVTDKVRDWEIFLLRVRKYIYIYIYIYFQILGHINKN